MELTEPELLRLLGLVQSKVGNIPYWDRKEQAFLVAEIDKEMYEFYTALAIKLNKLIQEKNNGD